ncbi:recombinase family protein [Sphingomonas faeni]|uniref:recombinase family protein n=1 Tax=Sphingomonas faeni TaxID=185950 RepID=UPI002785AC56|nr:DNA invertase Pin-like site-specific DNA recombinase [Sphingomonas faeni]
MSEQEKRNTIQAARVYLRVSTEEQDLARQEAIVAGARAAGFYVAAVYWEKASGARPDRPELLRMVADLQPGEVVVAEKIDRISRLPLAEAELLVATIRGKGARLAVPGIVDLSDLVAESSGVARIVLEAVQEMLLRLALQTARDDYVTRRERQREGIEIARREGRYTGRKPDVAHHRRIVGFVTRDEHNENGGVGRMQHCASQASDRVASGKDSISMRGCGRVGRGGFARVRAISNTVFLR